MKDQSRELLKVLAKAQPKLRFDQNERLSKRPLEYEKMILLMSVLDKRDKIESEGHQIRKLKISILTQQGQMLVTVSIFSSVKNILTAWYCQAALLISLLLIL